MVTWHPENAPFRHVRFFSEFDDESAGCGEASAVSPCCVVSCHKKEIRIQGSNGVLKSVSSVGVVPAKASVETEPLQDPIRNEMKVRKVNNPQGRQCCSSSMVPISCKCVGNLEFNVLRLAHLSLALPSMVRSVQMKEGRVPHQEHTCRRMFDTLSPGWGFVGDHYTRDQRRTVGLARYRVLGS